MNLRVPSDDSRGPATKKKRPNWGQGSDSDSGDNSDDSDNSKKKRAPGSKSNSRSAQDVSVAPSEPSFMKNFDEGPKKSMPGLRRRQTILAMRNSFLK